VKSSSQKGIHAWRKQLTKTGGGGKTVLLAAFFISFHISFLLSIHPDIAIICCRVTITRLRRYASNAAAKKSTFGNCAI
jgi:hypothetical protein